MTETKAEAERDAAKLTAKCFRQEADAIFETTRERCAQVAAECEETFHTEARRMAARDIKNRIRALKPSEERQHEGKND